MLAAVLFFSIGPVVLILGQPRLRRWRLGQVEREFMAAWGHLSPAAKRRCVAQAWGQDLLPILSPSEQAARMRLALHEYARQMAANGVFDVAQMRARFWTLLAVAPESMARAR